MPLVFSPTGLEIQTQQEIFNELAGLVQAQFGANTNVSPTSIMGQLLNIFAEFIALNQQVLLATYASYDPEQAAGDQLDRLAELTGTIRRGETFSVVEGVIRFSGPAVVPDGSQIRNDDNNTIWQAINGPYTDGGGPYPEDVPAFFQAVDAGPVIGQANTNWSPVTIITGFSDFLNPTDDAFQGALEESDEAFRIRRNEELYRKTIGPRGAISAQVGAIDGENGTVVYARTYHNPSITPVDSDGIPFKAFNVVVRTNPDPPPLALQQEIFDTIGNAMGAGGEAYGTDYTGFWTDIESQSQPVAFDVLQNLGIFIVIDVTTTGNSAVFPPHLQQMADLIRATVLEQALAQFQVIGQTLSSDEFLFIAWNLKATGQIKGVLNIDCTIGDTNLDQFAFFPVGIRQIAQYDSVNILINIDGNPY